VLGLKQKQLVLPSGLPLHLSLWSPSWYLRRLFSIWCVCP